jgi:hypothetical protein
MSHRSEVMPRDDLEARLADLAGALAFPPTPDLAAAVGSELRAQARGPEARRPLIAFPPTVRRSLLLAAALALLVVGTALAVRYGLELLSIRFGPVPTAAPTTAPSSSSGASGEALDLGRRVTLEEADEAAPFDVLLPEVLGRPDAIYLGGARLRGQVSFVYAPRADLPESSLLDGAALLVTQNSGTADAGVANKIADSSRATVEPVDVDGSPGVWISGEPHLFWYVAPDGTYIEESRRLVGDTLAWERDGILYRLEGAINLPRALEIARSMRSI